MQLSHVVLVIIFDCRSTYRDIQMESCCENYVQTLFFSLCTASSYGTLRTRVDFIVLNSLG